MQFERGDKFVLRIAQTLVNYLPTKEVRSMSINVSEKRIEKIIFLMKKIQLNKDMLLMSIVYSALIIYYFNPLVSVDLDRWDGTIGLAVISGISVDKRIGNLYFAFGLYFLVLFVCWGGFSYVFNNKIIFIKSMKMISAILIVPTITIFINRYMYADGSEINNSSIVNAVLVLGFAIILLALLDRKKLLIEKDIYFLCIFYLVSILSGKMLLHECDSLLLDIGFGIVILIIFASVCFFTTRELLEKLEYFMSFLLWLPFIMSLTLEVLYVLNGKNIFVVNYYRIVLLGIFMYLLVVFCLFRFGKKYFGSVRQCIQKNYLGAICSIGGVIAFCQYKTEWDIGEGYGNLYEFANMSVGQETFLDGKIPILDYFSAHALGDVWHGLLYAFINGDYRGIMVSPYFYCSILMGIIICYYLFKQMFDVDIVVLILMLFPLDTIIRWNSLCLISVLATINLIKRQKISSYIAFWCVLALSAFTRYDDGIAIGVGCIATIILVIILNRDKLEGKRFVFSGAGVTVAMFAFYFLYCCMKGINPIQRIKQWIYAALDSTSIWATADFGNAQSFAFFFAYFVVPVITIVIFLIVFVQWRKDKVLKLSALVVMIFSISVIFFVPRTIIFHNLIGGGAITGVLLNYFPWVITIFAIYLCERKHFSMSRKVLCTFCTLGFVIYLAGLTISGIIPTGGSSFYAQASTKAESVEIKDDMSALHGKKRIVYTDNTNALVDNFNDVFSRILKDDETFLDFANVSALYALLGRTRPGYVSQIPSLLTNIESQELFIEEVKQSDVPLAVTGMTDKGYIIQLQGIPHNVRYYKVAEYIYANYRPLIAVNDFAIWCKKDSYEQYKAILMEGYSFSEVNHLIEFGYDAGYFQDDGSGNLVFVYQNYLHSYDMKKAPFLWANYDRKKASENTVVCSANCLGDKLYAFSGSQNIEHSQGNYLIFKCRYHNDSLSAKEEENVLSVTLTDSSRNEMRYEYKMDLQKGENQYMIRVSSDYFWSAFNIDNIQFSANGDVEIEDVCILQGD